MVVILSSGVDTFFDGLVATHKTGSLLQEDHYHPFGLGMNGARRLDKQGWEVNL